MKTAVIYARYSSDRQTEQSIEGQLRKCNEYAEQHDIVVVDTYIDRAMTGTNDKRNDFQRMLRDSSKRAWDYVLVYKIDRFGRNKYEIAMNKHTLKNNGIKLLSAMENIPDTPEGIILESLLEGMAEYYSAELSQKVRRGMNETRIKGNFTGGFLPYGFKKDGKKVAIDEDKAQVVRYIYDQYAKNVYVKDIISDLTAKGILNKGKPFAKNTLHRILQNEKYVGIYRHGEEVFTNMYPQIVSEELFNLVQAKNTNNKYGSRSPYVIYLLHKKIVCGYCGKTINGITGTSKSGEIKRYYACSGRYSGKKNCKKKTTRKEALEEIIIRAIMQVFQDEKFVSKIADKIIETNDKRLHDQSILNLLKQEQDKIIKAKNNILSAIEMGIFTPSTKDRLQELEKKDEEMSEKILLEQTKERMTVDRNDIIGFVKKALNNKAERIIDLLVKQIVLYDDKVEIKCNYTPHKNDDELDLPIYNDKVQLPMTADKDFIVNMQDVDLVIKV